MIEARVLVQGMERCDFVPLKGNTLRTYWGHFQNTPSQCFLGNAEEEFRETSIDAVEISNMLKPETPVEVVGSLRNGKRRGN